MPSDALALIGRGLSLLIGQAVEASPQWGALMGTLADIAATTRQNGILLLALTNAEQQAVNDLSEAVSTLATDLATAGAAAADVKAQMQTQIDALVAGDAVTAAQIAAMQATADALETEVIGNLTPITAKVQAIDSGLTNPATPLTPAA